MKSQRGHFIAGLIGIVELVLVIGLAAVWADSIQNLDLSSIVRTAIPALIGLGIGACLVAGSRSFKRRLLDDAEAIQNHPYLKELQSFFDQDTYNIFGDQMHKDEILRVHNNLPGRLKFRSIMLHPMVEEEMGDYEHSGLEETARVPIPEPWITTQEELMVSELARICFEKPLIMMNLDWRARSDHLDVIEADVIRDMKNLADIPWPVMVHENGKFRYQANGSIERRSK